MSEKPNSTDGPTVGIFFGGPDRSRSFYLRVETDHGVLHLPVAHATVEEYAVPGKPGATAEGTQLVFNWVVHEHSVRVRRAQVRCEIVYHDDLDDPESGGECEDEPVGPELKYKRCIIPAGEPACWTHQLDWIWQPEDAEEEDDGDDD
jgi:hypothetical protein